MSIDASSSDVDDRPERPDTIAPVSDALYPRALDGVPTFFGRLNPLTAVLLFYTGAMLRESREVPIIGLQWMLLVVVPTFGALYAARRWWYEHKVVPNASKESKYRPMGFNRACRSAWIDFHIGYMLLVPAGAYGGEGSSWWVMTAPALMALRWLGGRKGKFFKMARRVSAVVFGVLGTAMLLISASTTIVKALTALKGGGSVGIVLAPFAVVTSYVLYLAPACLLPQAISRAWTNTLDVETESMESTAKSTEKDKTPEEIAKEKKKKRVNLIVTFIAFGTMIATGSDIPLLILFAIQLLKIDPEELMNAVINKGSPERAEMEQAFADKFAAILPRATKKESSATERDDGDDDDDDDDTKTPPDQTTAETSEENASSVKTPSA